MIDNIPPSILEEILDKQKSADESYCSKDSFNDDASGIHSFNSSEIRLLHKMRKNLIRNLSTEFAEIQSFSS